MIQECTTEELRVLRNVLARRYDATGSGYADYLLAANELDRRLKAGVR